MFIGPTSQAPRIDEARNDSVYEIEIAFAELRRVAEVEAGTTPPWLVDRLLRNLLIDVTGNTHRAEFCIDKLYSPDGPTGRLGLLEMRAFEMPPHARMSLVQQLLMRALVARFWADALRAARGSRAGAPSCTTASCCRTSSGRTSTTSSASCSAAGYPFELDWFAPHLEFRFPLLGDFAAAGVEVELRMALEPWHVLGEESGAGGTARYVDSSRRAHRGAASAASSATATCSPATAAACRCSRPASPASTSPACATAPGRRRRRCTRPSPAHAPLVFDLVDTWMSRSLGGCQYHVAHPGGRNYTTFPVNALEAEARRLGALLPHWPHAGHRHRSGRAAPNPDFPFTLDLRRPPAAR